MSFTSAIYDGKTALQLQIEFVESNFASDGSSSIVTANYYLISVNQPAGRFTGDIGSDYGTGQTITCSLGSKSQTFSTNAYAIADAVNKFGDKFYIGSLSTTVSRSATGNANIRASASTTLIWISGYPSRSISGTYSCIDTKHTVTYNANGGTNAPSAQTKAYGHILTLRSSIPTRGGYKFMGWSTKASGSVEYASGGKYGVDNDVTMYAVWKLIDINITLSPTDIRIPCAFKSGKYGFDYFYSDPDYYIEIPYSYSFNGTVKSLTAKPFYVDNEDGAVADASKNAESSSQSLYGTSGTVRVSMNTIGKSIINYNNESEVVLGILFSFNVDGTDVTSEEYVTCPLKDFKFFTVRESSAYLDQNSNNLMYFKFLITYPPSYDPNVQLANAFPMFMHDSFEVMLSVSKKSISDGLMLVTCCSDVSAYGRNLILNSSGKEQKGFFASATINGDYGSFTFKPKTTQYPSFNTSNESNVVVIKADDYTAGDTYVWSLDFMCTELTLANDNSLKYVRIGQRVSDSTTGKYTGVTLINLNLTDYELNKWYHVTQTITIPTVPSSEHGTYFMLQGAFTTTDDTTTVTLCLKNVKLEKGDTATEWTPAPEDTNAMGSLTTINYLDSVLLYNENPSFNKSFTVKYPLLNNNIIIKDTSDCEGFEFIETDQVSGFLKGGYICAKEFIEDSESVLLGENNFNFKEIMEI